MVRPSLGARYQAQPCRCCREEGDRVRHVDCLLLLSEHPGIKKLVEETQRDALKGVYRVKSSEYEKGDRRLGGTHRVQEGPAEEAGYQGLLGLLV